MIARTSSGYDLEWRILNDLNDSQVRNLCEWLRGREERVVYRIK